MAKRLFHSDNPLVVVSLLTAAVAACWPLLVILRDLGFPEGNPVPAASLLVALGAAGYLARRMAESAGEPSAAGWALIGAMLLVIRFHYYPGRWWADLGWLGELASGVFRLGPMLPAVLLLAGAWAMGTVIAARGAGYDRAYDYLASLLMVLVGGGVASGLASRTLGTALGGEVTAAVTWFGLAGLTALAASRVDVIRSACSRTGNRLMSGWLGLTLMAVLGAVGLITTVAGGVRPRVPSAVIAVTRLLLDLIGRALELILYPLAFVVGVLFRALQWLVSRFDPESVVWDNVPSVGVEDVLLGEGPLAGVPELRWVVAGLVLVLAALFLWRLLRQPAIRSRLAMGEFSEERIPLRPTLGRRGTDKGHGGRLAPPPDDDAAERLALRKQFGRVLHWSRERDLPRPPDATATEFCRRVAAQLAPGAEEELRQLLELYLPTRYGLYRPSAEEIMRATELADRIIASENRSRG